MLKIFITSLICTLMLFCTNVSAADFQAGDTAYVKAGIESMSVYQNPSYGRSVAVVIQYLPAERIHLKQQRLQKKK